MATHHITTNREQYVLPQGTVNLMREWVLDCEWGEDPEYLSRLNAQQLVRGIEQHYDGGFPQFLRDSEAQAHKVTANGIGPVKAHYWSGKIEDVTGEVLESQSEAVIAALPPLAKGSFYAFHRERWAKPYEVEALVKA